MSASNDHSPLLGSVRRVASHWKPAAIAFTCMFGVIAVLVFLLPNQYQSRAKILLKNARVDPMVSLNQQTQGVLYVDEVSEARINTEIELLTSNDVLRKVVSLCHLGEGSGRKIRDPKLRDDLALRQLQKALQVQAVRKSNIIQVNYSSPEPKRSANVVRTLVDLYLRAHVQLHGSPGSSNVFRQIADQYAAQLHQAQEQLADFRKTHRIVSLGEEKSLALQQESELEKSLVAAQAAMRGADREAIALQHEVSGLPESIAKEERALPNQSSAEQLAVLLVSLENKRTEALQRYVPSDRVVRELDQQIGNTEAALKSERTESSQELTTGSNPTRLSAEDQYVRARANAEGNRAQADSLAQQVKSSRARLVALDAATVTYQNLEQRTKQFQDLADFYKKKSDEAQVNDQLDTQRISNVGLAEAPYAEELPSSPKRGLILSLGFAWSLLLAVVTAFVADLLRGTVHEPYELEQLAQVPLLASLPTIAVLPVPGIAFPAAYLSMQRHPSESLRSTE